MNRAAPLSPLTEADTVRGGKMVLEVVVEEG